MKPVQVFVTTGSREEAEGMVRALIERRLVACAQILGPIRSTYWWEGKIEESEEYLCLLKADGERFDRLVEEIKAVHSYSVPEVVAVPIELGSADYLRWMGEVLGAT